MNHGKRVSRRLRLSHNRARSGTDIRDDLLLRILLRHSPDEIYFKDRDSRFVRASAATAKRFGLDSPDDLVGKWDLDFFSQESGEEYREAERVMMEGGDPLIDEDQEEIWSDGHVTWVACTKLPLRDQDGEVIGVFGLNLDIAPSPPRRCSAGSRSTGGSCSTLGDPEVRPHEPVARPFRA
jgi:PAS domain S-box-containing protein